MVVKIALVGEAYGEKEEELGLPFVGPTGWLLDQILSQVGIDRRDCLVTNVFNLRPKPKNDVLNLCGPKPEGIPGLPFLARGKYVRKEFAPELDRLYSEIRDADPNLIVCLGATAAWAFLHTSGIKSIRGVIAATHPKATEKLGRVFKVLPTYHPAAISRQWNLRPVLMADLDKARREGDYHEIRRPSRSIWINPTIHDLEDFERDSILPSSFLSADIETAKDQITCIGFAPSPSEAIVIPFFSEQHKDRNYWRTLEEELLAWDYVRRWLALKPTLFQNGMYDIQFLWRSYGIPVPLAAEDTMLMHHAQQLEMEKGLGFLASIYTDEASWKFMRKGKKHD